MIYFFWSKATLTFFFCAQYSYATRRTARILFTCTQIKLLHGFIPKLLVSRAAAGKKNHMQHIPHDEEPSSARGSLRSFSRTDSGFYSRARRGAVATSGSDDSLLCIPHFYVDLCVFLFLFQ